MLYTDDEYKAPVGKVHESVCLNCNEPYYFNPPVTEKLCYDCDPRNDNQQVKDNNFIVEHERLFSHKHISEPANNFVQVRNIPTIFNKRYVKNLLQKERRRSPDYTEYMRNYLVEYRKTDKYKLWRESYIPWYKNINRERLKEWRTNYRKLSAKYKSWRKKYRNSPGQHEKELAYKREYRQRPRSKELNRLYAARRRLRVKNCLNN